MNVCRYYDSCLKVFLKFGCIYFNALDPVVPRSVAEAYHSGVEVFGGEYVFGGGNTSFSGVTVQRPKVPPPGSGWTFYQTVEIAPCRFSRDDAMRGIQDLRAEFPASGYDLMARNCNHFAEALCQKLCTSNCVETLSLEVPVGAVHFYCPNNLTECKPVLN